jgi:hypothetical protein
MNGVLAILMVSACVTLVPPTPERMVGSQARTADPLQPLAFLIGRWEGSSEGQPGTGIVKREYTRILNDRFIRAQNQSVYPPQERNPKGENHEDLGVFSFDKSRSRMVFRPFPHRRVCQPLRRRRGVSAAHGRVHERGDREYSGWLARPGNIRRSRPG